MRLSNNALSTFRRCQRAYQYAYIDKMEPKGKSEPLIYGTAWHEVMEPLWAAKPLDAALAKCNTDDPFRSAEMRALLLGYDTLWKRDEFDTIAVEEAFDLPFDDITINGRIDAIAKDTQGRIWIVEHKTTSADLEDPTYWQQLRLDPQISMYWRALKKMGLEPYGCLYDVTRKPTIEPRKATPLGKREYTAEKTKVCPLCKKKGAEPGPHLWHVGELGGALVPTFEASGLPILTCNNGKVVTEPSRLHAKQRDRDETPEEYFERLVADIGENPSKYYRRATVARDAQDEFDAHMDDVWTITAIKSAESRGAFPRNPDSCRKFNSVCGYFPVCIREAEITDTNLYQIRKKAS